MRLFRPNWRIRVIICLRDAEPTNLPSGARLSAEAHVWSGSLYPFLYFMESVGLIKSSWNGNGRRVYWLVTNPPAAD